MRHAFAALLVVLIGSPFCFALDFQSSRTLSLSQAGRGGALLNDTITLNPSLLGFQAVASLSGTYSWTPRGSENGSTRTYNASVIDGKNPYVNAGLSFTRRPDIDFIHVALAKRTFDWLSVGLSVKRFSSNSNTKAALGRSVTGYDGGLSLGIAFPPNLIPFPVQIGIVSDNLRHMAGDEVFTGPRQIGVGAKVTLKELLMLYGDYVQNQSHKKGTFPQYNAGAELSLGSDLYVRGGLLGFRETGWSAGGGWVGPKLGASYGFQTRKAQAARFFQHGVTIDIYM